MASLTGLEGAFAFHGFRPRVEDLMVDELPGAGVLGRVLVGVMGWIVVFRHRSRQVVRLADVPATRGLTLQDIDEERQLPE